MVTNDLSKRLLRTLQTLVHLMIDKLYSPLYFAFLGVQTGSGLQIAGLPWLDIEPNSHITIGDSVKLLSRPISSHQFIRPCTFFLIRTGAQIDIGNSVSMSSTFICAATNVTIGSRVTISANCILSDTDYHPLGPEARHTNPTRQGKSLPIVIGEDVFIGENVVVLKGTILGAGCVVESESVVSGVFPPNSVIVGNPGKIVKTRESQSL